MDLFGDTTNMYLPPEYPIIATWKIEFKMTIVSVEKVHFMLCILWLTRCVTSTVTLVVTLVYVTLVFTQRKAMLLSCRPHFFSLRKSWYRFRVTIYLLNCIYWFSLCFIFMQVAVWLCTEDFLQVGIDWSKI